MSITVLTQNIIGVNTVSDQYPHNSGTYIHSHDTLSINNDYVPTYSLMDGIMISGTRKVLQYGLGYKSSRIHQKSKFSDFAAHLYFGIHDHWIQLSNSSIGNKYIAKGGILIHEDYNEELKSVATPLMMMTVKTRHLFDIKKGEFKPYQFCLLIDKSFSNPEHFQLFRNLKKYYINIAGKVVDVMYCNSIIETVFSNPVRLPRFATIAEAVEHTKSMNQLILNNL